MPFSPASVGHGHHLALPRARHPTCTHQSRTHRRLQERQCPGSAHTPTRRGRSAPCRMALQKGCCPAATRCKSMPATLASPAHHSARARAPAVPAVRRTPHVPACDASRLFWASQRCTGRQARIPPPPRTHTPTGAYHFPQESADERRLPGPHGADDGHEGAARDGKLHMRQAERRPW